MCDWENLEGNFIDRHTVQREKYLEGNLPRQTLNDICSLDDGSSPRTYSQKLGQAHNNQPAFPSLLLCTKRSLIWVVECLHVTNKISSVWCRCFSSTKEKPMWPLTQYFNNGWFWGSEYSESENRRFRVFEKSKSKNHRILVCGGKKKNQNQRVAGWLFQRTVGFHERTDQESAVYRVVIWGHNEPAPTSTPSTGCPLLLFMDEREPS